MISIFDGNPDYFTAVNLAHKTYHRERYDELGRVTRMLNSINNDNRSESHWVKVKEHKRIAGHDTIGYKCFDKKGRVDGEAWYFTERKCTAGDFLRMIFGVPVVDRELGELTIFEGGKPKLGVKTLKVEVVNLPPNFFDIPKICIKDAGRFGVMNGALEGIEGFADDLMGQESRQFHPKPGAKKP